MAAQKIVAKPTSNDIPRTAEVVVIGGGPAGTAALWAIERLAPGTKTVLLETHDHLGAGSSTASLEAFRTCWAARCLAKQMERSTAVFLHADDYLGEGASRALAVRQNGYLFCGFTDQQAATLQADVGHLKQVGMDHIEHLEADEIAYRFPWLGDRVIAAKYDPIAGWLDSNSLINLYVREARSAHVLLNVKDARIRTEGGKVTGVSTEYGNIATPTVIIAAGAGARAVGRTAGVELPIVARPRQSFTTPWRHFPSEAPMTIGAAPFPHVHPEGGSGAIFGWEYNWNSKRISPDNVQDALVDPIFPMESLKDPRFPSITLALLARQFGHQDGQGFASPNYLRGIHHNIGYYMYRDHSTAYWVDENGQPHPYESERAILDAHPAVAGLFLSIAHVGHGIMTSPAAGEIIASLVLGLDLPDPIYADFGLSAHWVAFDENAL